MGKREGYENSNALYEVYVTDPAEVSKESELVTEVYYPVKKKGSKRPKIESRYCEVHERKKI